GEQLNGENGVDLADELVADVDGCFGHGAAKLMDIMLACWPVRAVATTPEAHDAPPHPSSQRHTLKSSGMLSSLLRGGPNRPWVSSRAAADEGPPSVAVAEYDGGACV